MDDAGSSWSKYSDFDPLVYAVIRIAQMVMYNTKYRNLKAIYVKTRWLYLKLGFGKNEWLGPCFGKVPDMAGTDEHMKIIQRGSGIVSHKSSTGPCFELFKL